MTRAGDGQHWDFSHEIERLLRIENLRQRFEVAWRAGEQPSLAHYLDEVAPADREALFADLLGVELELRRDRGEGPTITEYRQKFLAYALQVDKVFQEAAGTVGFRWQQLALGTVLGDYRLDRVLGRGGMGVVYAAEQLSLGRQVALKVLSPDRPTLGQGRPRFFREVRAAAGLHHTNIVPVLEVGECDGVLFYAMQLIEGRSLHGVVDDLRKQYRPGESALSEPTVVWGASSTTAGDSAADSIPGNCASTANARAAATPPAENEASGNGQRQRSERRSLSADEGPTAARSVPAAGAFVLTYGDRDYWQHAGRIGRHVAEALQHAHERGILHRDVKPANLLIDARGEVWVTDFGLAKVDGSDLTEAGDVVGTLRYLPPEALEGRADARSDVYSLGLTLYELLTLKCPFTAGPRSRLLRQISQAEIEPLPHVAPHVPRDLATIVGKATQRDPRDRYQTAQQLADDLDRFLHDRPILARRHSPAELLVRWVRRSPVVAGLATATVLLLILVAASSILAAVHFRQLQLQQSRFAEEREQQRRTAEFAADRARAAEQQTLRGLADLHRQQGNRRLEQGDHLPALMSYVLALGLLEPHANSAAPSGELTLAESLRCRIAALLECLPLLVARQTLDAYDWSRPVFDPVSLVLASNPPQLRFLPEGELSVVSTFYDAAFRWNPATDTLRRVTLTAADAFGAEAPPADGAAVPAALVRFTPDGRHAVRCCGGAPELWSCEPEQMVCRLESAPEGVAELLGCWLTPDGRRLLVGFPSGPLKADFFLWDVPTGRRLHATPFQIQGTLPPFLGVRFSGDGRRLMLCAAEATVFDIERGTSLLTSTPRVSPRAGWDFRGRYLVGPRSNCIQVRDLDLPVDAPPIAEIPLPQGTFVTLVACDDHGRWAVAGTLTGEVYVIDLEQRCLAAAPIRHSFGQIQGIEITPPAEAVAVSDVEGTVRVWSLPAAKPVTAPLRLREPVSSLAWRDDGQRLAAATVSGDLTIWDLPHRVRASGDDGQPRNLVLSPDGRKLLSWPARGDLSVWDLAARPPRVIATAVVSDVAGAAWHPDGSQIAILTQRKGTSPCELHLWETQKSESPSLAYQGNHRLDTMGKAAGFMEDGSKFAFKTLKGPVIVDVERGVEIPTPDLARVGYKEWDHCAISNRFLAGCPRATLHTAESRLRIVAPTGELIWEAPLPASWPVHQVAFSPDGTRLAVAGDFGLRLWRCCDWQPLPTETPNLNVRIQRVYWDATGERLAFVDDNSVCRVAQVQSDLTFGEPFHVLGRTQSLTFSPDAKRLVVVTVWDGVTVWDWTRGEALTPVYLMGRHLRQAVFCTDDSTLAIRPALGDLEWLSVPLAIAESWEELLLRVQRTTGFGLTPDREIHRLTPAEWKHVIHRAVRR